MKLPLVLVLVLVGAGPVRAADQAVNTLTLPLPRYLELMEKAEPAKPAAPTKVEPSQLAAQRLAVKLDGDTVTMESSFEVVVKSAGAPALILSVPGRVETINLHGGAATLGRNTSGLLEWSAAAPGRYRVTLLSRLAADPQAEALFVRVPESSAPVYEVTVDFPVERQVTLSAGVVLANTQEAGRKKLRFSPPPQAPAVVSFARTTPTAAPQLEAFARAVVVTHLDIKGEEIVRTDTVLVEVLRGELDRLEARLPQAGDLLAATMDDGGEVVVTRDPASLSAIGRRKTRLDKNGFLKLSWRLPSDVLGGELVLPPIEPTIPVRARYLVVSSAVAAELVPLPAERWSAINLTDPPEALAAELANRPPAAGWRLDLDPATTGREVPRLSLQRLPVVVAAPPPLSARQTITYLNADGSLLVQERYLLDRHVEALELVLPEGLSLASAKVSAQLVQPILRDGVHLVPIAYSAEVPIVVEVTMSDRQRLSFAKRARHRFVLPRLKAEVFTHRWDWVLPEQLTASRLSGALREVAEGWLPPQAANGDESVWRVDGVVITDMGAIGSAPSYYNFNSFEEPLAGEADEMKVKDGKVVRREELENSPTGRDPWQILQKAPGVLADRVNVGGNEGGQQSAYISPGTTVEARPAVAVKARVARFSAVLPEPEVSLELELAMAKKRGRS